MIHFNAAHKSQDERFFLIFHPLIQIKIKENYLKTYFQALLILNKSDQHQFQTFQKNIKDE